MRAYTHGPSTPRPDAGGVAGRFHGVGPALVTPMTADGEPDLEAFAHHVRFVVDAGVHFLVPCGTTGESATLSPDEQRRVIETCVQAADGRVPVMAGAGTNATADAVTLVRAAAEAGADAILSVSPYYNRPSPEGLFRHYAALSDAAGIPLFVYNVPGRTGSNVPPSVLFRLAEETEHVAGVKEASGDVQQAMTILRDRPDGFVVLSGEDHLTFALMALGAEGVVSVVANEAPGAMAKMTEALREGRLRPARELHERLLGLMRANFLETNPVPVKTALGMMGRMEAHMRLPLCEMEAASRDRLREALVGAGLLDADAGEGS